jgi:hypothetical protein
VSVAKLVLAKVFGISASAALVLALAGSAGCSRGSVASPDAGRASSGGAPSSGGSTGNVGAKGGAGGAGASGGVASSGGSSASGGSSSVGGSGGTAGAGTGGSSGVGGAGSAGSAGWSGADAAVDGNAGRDAISTSDLASSAVDAASLAGTNNPVLQGLFADPNVVLFDKTFYIYPTTDGFADWGATSFSVFSSTNLVQWTNRGVVLNLPSDLKWATGRAWAPSATQVGDTYYFYFTAEDQIGVATSKSPTGPFKDPLGKPLIGNRQYGVVSIDPYVFTDDDGQHYLYFGNSGIRVGKLNPDMVSFAATPSNIDPSGISGTVEGSTMFKRKGTYYLQWSEGDTRLPTYRVAYGRAQSPLGPFTRLAVILEQDAKLGILSAGGSTVLGIPSRDEYYMVYHRFKIPGGDGTHRETCIDRLSFNSDGTIVPVKPTLEGLQTAVLP